MCAKNYTVHELWDLCLESADGSSSYQSLPPMRMYFHEGFSEIMWFREWVPKTSGEYWFAIAVVVLMGISNTQFIPFMLNNDVASTI